MSNVDPTVPSAAIAFTADVRKNFSVIKGELEVLQAFMNQRGASDSPVFTGTTQMDNASLNGTLTVAGQFTPTLEAYILTQVPTITIAGNVSAYTADPVLGGLKFNKDATGAITLSGGAAINLTAVNAPGQIAAIKALNVALYNSGQSIHLPQIDTSGVGWYIRVKSDGSVWVGIINNGGVAPPYVGTVTFSGTYRIAP